MIIYLCIQSLKKIGHGAPAATPDLLVVVTLDSEGICKVQLAAFVPACGESIEIVTLLTTISASSTNLKEFKLHTVCSWI